VQWVAAPRIGDDAVSSRPYAGNSEYPTVLVCAIHLLIRCDMGSKNPFGADNQQERFGAMVGNAGLSIENPQRPNADQVTGPIGSPCELKLWSGPYGDVGRSAETTDPPIARILLRDWL
jgi:hypothetical protein